MVAAQGGIFGWVADSAALLSAVRAGPGRLIRPFRRPCPAAGLAALTEPALRRRTPAAPALIAGNTTL